MIRQRLDDSHVTVDPSDPDLLQLSVMRACLQLLEYWRGKYMLFRQISSEYSPRVLWEASAKHVIWAQTSIADVSTERVMMSQRHIRALSAEIGHHHEDCTKPVQ